MSPRATRQRTAATDNNSTGNGVRTHFFFQAPGGVRVAMASFPVAERGRCPFDSIGYRAASKGAHTNTGGLGGRAVGQTVLLTIFSATMFFFFAASVDISRGTLTTPHTNAHTQTMRRKHKRRRRRTLQH